MRSWDGIRLDTAATDDGAVFVLNPSYFTEGELQRRMGMEGALAQSGTGIINFVNPMTGYFAVFATSTGSIVALAAP